MQTDTDFTKRLIWTDTDFTKTMVTDILFAQSLDIDRCGLHEDIGYKHTDCAVC